VLVTLTLPARRLARSTPAALLALVFAASTSAAHAQIVVPQQRDTTPTQPAIPVTAVSPPAPASAVGDDRGTPNDRSPVLLDAPVSRQEYLLGPGDGLDITVFGEFNHLYSVTVNPEGSVVLPGVGITPVLGLNLDQAEQRVRQTASRYLRNVEVRLSLARVRTFKVFVVGNVAVPGSRTATAASRLSEVLGTLGVTAARGRNIVLRRASGDSVRVDLVRFVQTGDVSANPVLREGDAVIVPTIDERVRVMGRVHYPADYEYRRGETLAELLRIANGGGGFPADAADTVRLVRFVGPQERSELSLSRAEAVGARGAGLALQPFDAIYVAGLSNFKEQHAATIGGQVRRPGAYPIRPDTTTVRELVEMAGGFTEQASLVDAVLRRTPAQRRRDEVASIPPELMSAQDRRISLVRGSADSAAVVIDFSQLFIPGTAAYRQTLRSGDEVLVPVRRVEVQVLGAVRNPGMIAYNAGSSVAQYVNAAGGLTRRADRGHALVLRARTGARLQVREAGVVEPGDAVIVPFREDHNTLQTIQLMSSIASILTGAILAGVAVLR
jgi:protein involved in polysaccharide export with SLBB domain